MLLVVGVLLLAGCKPASSDCRARVQKLRERIATIDWSIVGLGQELPYAEIPVGDGQNVMAAGNWEWRSPILIHATGVQCDGELHSVDASLSTWLRDCGSTFRLTGPSPFYVLARKDTPSALVRRVVAILESMGEVRVTVRPARVEEPWRPRRDHQAFFDQMTRRVPLEKRGEWNEALVRSVLVPAEGCSEAEDVAKHPWMSPADRLARLPDAFEKCGCDGDLETMAALYWFMVFDETVPIRWHAWDEAVAEQVGDDATYEQLARALTEKYLASRR